MNDPFSPIYNNPVDNSPHRLHNDDRPTPVQDIFDQSVLEECVEWIVQWSIYASTEHHQLIRSKSLKSKRVLSWVKQSTRRTCDMIKNRFKKCFTSILPNYCKCSESQQIVTIQFIEERAERQLRSFNVYVPVQLY